MMGACKLSLPLVDRKVILKTQKEVSNAILAVLINQSLGQPMDQRIQSNTNYMTQKGL